MSQKQAIRILIADDHPIVRAGIAANVSDRTQAVITALKRGIVTLP